MRNPNFRWKNLNWPNIFGLGSVHVLACFAPWFFSWIGVLFCIFFYWQSIWVGIGIGYHRLLTHGSFKTPDWFKYVLTLCATLAWEGGPFAWVGAHRIHHKFADMKGDPHTPNEGGDWAHVLWTIFRFSPEQHKEIVSATPDLRMKPLMVFINTYFWFPQIALTGALLGFGMWRYDFHTAFSWVVWGVGVRTVLGLHATWLVNSVCHMWGKRRFNTKDTSKNNIWIAFPTGGESWHNNHHKYPWSARHGLAWDEIDMTWLTIRLLRFLGLAKSVREAHLSSDILEVEQNIS